MESLGFGVIKWSEAWHEEVELQDNSNSPCDRTQNKIIRTRGNGIRFMASFRRSLKEDVVLRIKEGTTG
jgi:hypothetical protein